MGLFFASTDNTAKEDHKKQKKQTAIETLEHLGCEGCPLNTRDADINMPPDGSDVPLVYVLGEAPGKVEQRKGKPFVGQSGKLLKKVIPREFKDDVRYNNIVRTRPPDNATPGWKEIAACRPSIIKDIEETEPVSIIALGASALEWLVNQDAKILSWRGRRGVVRIGSHDCWFYPVFHPSYVLYMAREGQRPLNTVAGDAFKRDVQRVFDEVEYIPDAECEVISEEGIEILESVDEWAAALNAIWEEESVAIDLETHKMRPFDRGAKILSVAVGTYEKTYTISFKHPGIKRDREKTNQIYDLLEDFLINSEPVKVFHNSPFDSEWLTDTYGEHVAQETKWGCSQAQAYILDQRAGCQSLDALCQLYFGINLKAYSDVDVANLINEPVDKVLRYNALDVKYTHKLFLEQQRRLEEQGRLYAYDNQIRRNKTLVLAQLRGVQIDTEKSAELDSFCSNKIEEIEGEIQETKGAKKYADQYGKPLNPGSPPQLITTFRDILQREEGQRGKKYSTDEAALTEMQDEPLAQKVLDYRAYSRLQSTFIRPLQDELLWWDGRVHASYQPYFVVTGRLSSRGPNLQNFPIRKFPWIRGQFVPDDECVFLAGDYGQIEARYIAMASGDENYIAKLKEHHDIHMDWAQRLAYDYPKIVGGKKFLNDEEAMDEWRGRVKNEWTFPLFFGSDADNCVKRTGIPKHIIYRHYDDFWDEFRGVGKWQGQLLADYDEKGYIENLTGRRYYYPLDKEKIINYPVQGGSSDITINAMDQLSEAAHEEDDPQLQPVINVHDDLTFCIRKRTMQDTSERILDRMLFPDFDWINVPISVDLKKGRNWHEMKKVGTFNSDEW